MSDEDERPEPDNKLRSFSEIATLPINERKRNLLRILDGLMAKAVADKDWPNTLKIFAEAAEIIQRK